MHHVAILNKKLNLLPLIISRQKTIESRWYKNKVAPWDKIKIGDTIYFKNSGEPITVKCLVSKVLQINISSQSDIQNIIRNYGKYICITSTRNEFFKDKRYCILIFIEKVEKLTQPFHINKKGYGLSTAWICVNNIEKIIEKSDKKLLDLQDLFRMSKIPVSMIEYTKNNYDNFGQLITKKIPTIMVDSHELGIYNDRIYFVVILKYKLFTRSLFEKLKLYDLQIYGWSNFNETVYPNKFIKYENIMKALLSESKVQLHFEFDINMSNKLIVSTIKDIIVKISK